MYVESVTLVIKENKEEKTCIIWFPAIRDFIEMPVEQFNTKEPILGRFFRYSFPVVCL